MQRGDSRAGFERTELDPSELARVAGQALRRQTRRHPYTTLAAAAALGWMFGAGSTRWRHWLAAGATLALRETARWAADEGLRRIIEAPSTAAFRRARRPGSRPRAEPH